MNIMLHNIMEYYANKLYYEISSEWFIYLFN